MFFFKDNIHNLVIIIVLFSFNLTAHAEEGRAENAASEKDTPLIYCDETGREADNKAFPSAGAEIIFTIKPEEKMPVRADYAVGKLDDSAFYLRSAQPL